MTTLATRIFRKGCIIALNAVLLLGCSLVTEQPDSTSDSPTSTPTATPVTAPPEEPQADNNQVLGSDVTCDSPSHFAKITWHQGLPYMTFALKPDALSLDNAPATATINPDVSLTYGVQGESDFFVRIYPNRSCFVQVLDSAGTVTLEENGRTL